MTKRGPEDVPLDRTPDENLERAAQLKVLSDRLFALAKSMRDNPKMSAEELADVRRQIAEVTAEREKLSGQN